MSALFAPFTVGGLTLPNRIAMAPMTRYFSPDGVPGEDVAAYYARRAAAGVGLLITEGTYVPHPSAHSFINVPTFYGEAALAGWAKVRSAVHAAGGRIFPQLWHVGGVREAGMAPDPAVPGFAPSEVEGLHPTSVPRDEGCRHRRRARRLRAGGGGMRSGWDSTGSRSMARTAI